MVKLRNLFYIFFFNNLFDYSISCSNSGSSNSVGQYSSVQGQNNYMSSPSLNQKDVALSSSIKDEFKSPQKILNMSTKTVPSRSFASKTSETMNKDKNDIFGSLTNMWNEGWQKIDNFFSSKSDLNNPKELIPFSKNLQITNVTYDFIIHPPSAWTYCEPYCGVEDQGIDVESVNDTITADVTDAINESFRTVLHVEPPNKNNIKITFSPKNILGEGFGDFYDREGHKYRIFRGGVVAMLSRNQTSSKKYTQPLSISFLSRHKMKDSKWDNLGYAILDRLTKIQKGFQLTERMKTTLKIGLNNY
uniref:Lipoprotein n=1 Tax=Parastrongyloides trichosuri TaxID=131310 RepID=A0A0N4Z8P1_PARTI